MKLRTCPDCSSDQQEYVVSDSGNWHWVRCECGAEGLLAESKWKAALKWKIYPPMKNGMTKKEVEEIG